MPASLVRFLRHCTIVAAVGTGAIVIVGPSGAAATPTAAEPSCDTGQFCYWAEPNYPGKPQILDISGVSVNVCVPLPNGAEARSFVNRTHRDITLYQSGHCSTEGDFRTYPGDGTYVPEAPYVARAVEIWDS